MYKPFRQPLQRLINQHGLTFTMVDVGASNGVRELPGLASYTTVYAFEPNAEEYRKLSQQGTLRGKRQPPYRKVVFSPYAVGATDGKSTLYITRSPMACGLLEPDLDRLREIKWKGCPYLPNFGESFFQVVRTEPVELRTLESFGREQGIHHIDYLKIDVEGSEYDVLIGAGGLLTAVSVIKAEVCFITFRKGQKLFSEVDLLLRAHGFDLLRYEVLPAQVGYKERTSPFSHAQSLGFPDPYGQPVQGDAIYVNRNLACKTAMMAQAIVLIEKGYLDEALFILKNRACLEDAALLTVLATYRGTLRRRLLEALLGLYQTLRSIPQRRTWLLGLIPALGRHGTQP